MSETNTDTHKLLEAIESSSKSGQVVSVDLGCTVNQLHGLLLKNVSGYWSMCEIEDEKVDVWCWTCYTPKDEFEFQLTVQCQPETT